MGKGGPLGCPFNPGSGGGASSTTHSIVPLVDTCPQLPATGPPCCPVAKGDALLLLPLLLPRLLLPLTLLRMSSLPPFPSPRSKA